MLHEIYNRLCNYDPKLGEQVLAYEPWGKTSIIIYLYNGLKYKVKIIDNKKLLIQQLSNEDVNKKFNRNDKN